MLREGITIGLHAGDANHQTGHKPRWLHLIRHGENPANLRRELSYKLIDYPLTAKGRWQAMRTAEFLLTKDIRAVYSSPLKRAAETASIIADMLRQRTIFVDEFRELDVGVLENAPANRDNWRIHDEILENWMNGDKSRSFPGGESFSSVVNRMKLGIRRVLSETTATNIVVVSHGGLINTTISSICHSLRDSERGNLDNCSITTLIFNSQAPETLSYLEEWAYVGHLFQSDGVESLSRGDR